MNASVPPSLEAVILKALEKDPALRHQTAGDLLADLERLARDDTAGGPPATAPVAKGAGGAPVSSRTRRLPWPRIAASVAVVGLAAGAWLLRSPPPPRILGGRAIAEAS
ncbi:MAG TPA: hypothetical protein VGB42_12610, partial [Candidatus Thermoplasmatota archaeon]